MLAKLGKCEIRKEVGRGSMGAALRGVRLLHRSTCRCIVMELVHDGTILKEHCRAENLFLINQAAEIFFKCAKAAKSRYRTGLDVAFELGMLFIHHRGARFGITNFERDQD